MTREHFVIVLGESKYGYKLTRDNFAIINSKSSIENGRIYDEVWHQEHYNRCMKNFDINMGRISLLKLEDFEKKINIFLEMHPLFEEVTDLNKYDGVSGYYMIIIAKYILVLRIILKKELNNIGLKLYHLIKFYLVELKTQLFQLIVIERLILQEYMYIKQMILI